MSGEIVTFPGATKPEEGPHLSGHAICGACQHEWTAVAPHGTLHLECPKCTRYWGTFKHGVEPERFGPATAVRRCSG